MTVDEADVATQVDALTSLLLRHRIASGCEKIMQEAIHQIFQKENLRVQKEFRLSGSERVDFYYCGIAVELKIGGSLSAVTRQVMRYAALENVKAVILVTTRMIHCNLPSRMAEKPITVVHLSPLI